MQPQKPKCLKTVRWHKLQPLQIQTKVEQVNPVRHPASFKYMFSPSSLMYPHHNYTLQPSFTCRVMHCKVPETYTYTNGGWKQYIERSRSVVC